MSILPIEGNMFGPTVASRVFINIISVVTAYLLAMNIRLAVYLDDWLNLNQVRKTLLQQCTILLNLLQLIDLLIHLKYIIKFEGPALFLNFI